LSLVLFTHSLVMHILAIFHLLRLPPHISPLFPYTTLFRSILSSHLLIPKMLKGYTKSEELYALRLTENIRYLVILNAYNSSLFRSEEHTSELQSRFDLVCRILLKKKKNYDTIIIKRWITCI